MSAIDQLFDRSRSYQQSDEAKQTSASPSKKIVIVTCMDARFLPEKVLGIKEGEAHILRSAGGAVTQDVLRAIVISQKLLGTEEIMLIHHTDCGALKVDQEALVADLGGTIEAATVDWRAGLSNSIEDNVKLSVKRLKSSTLLPSRDEIRGFIYDVTDGTLSEVAT